jgi:hypothetical protein
MATGQVTYAECREIVWRREGQACGCCGRRLELAAVHAHHRRMRSTGRLDCACNLLATCARCHEQIHRSPADARRSGLLVSGYHRGCPGQAPVDLFGRGVVQLGCDGSFVSLKSTHGLDTIET